jgi:hypothetical protein
MGLQAQAWLDCSQRDRGNCPTDKFEFKDFDGEQITATCKIEEREWQRGRGIFRLLFIGRNLVRRSLDLQFSSEVGKRKGSWKGGMVGHSIEMLAEKPPRPRSADTACRKS